MKRARKSHWMPVKPDSPKQSRVEGSQSRRLFFESLEDRRVLAPITGIVAGVPDLTLALGTNLTKFCTTQFDAVTGTTGATLTNIVGLTGIALVASGVYQFQINISGVSTANSGIKLGFKYTTLTLTDMEAVGVVDEQQVR